MDLQEEMRLLRERLEAGTTNLLIDGRSYEEMYARAVKAEVRICFSGGGAEYDPPTGGGQASS